MGYSNGNCGCGTQRIVVQRRNCGCNTPTNNCGCCMPTNNCGCVKPTHNCTHHNHQAAVAKARCQGAYEECIRQANDCTNTTNAPTTCGCQNYSCCED